MKISHNDENEICFCPLFGLLDVIAKKWALLIIAILGNEGEKGFNELRSELDAISPRTLSQTLKKLEDLHLVNKHILATSPPHVRYSLYQRGREAPRIPDTPPCMGFGTWCERCPVVPG